MPRLLALAVVLFASAAHPQLSQLDDAAFADGLRAYQLGDLLVHFADNQPNTDDATAHLIAAAGHRLSFQNTASPDALEQTLAELQAAIDAAPDDPRRPIWLTDLAELLLLATLDQQQNLAADFVLFGQPSPEQQAAFDQAVPRAFQALQDAEDALYQLQGTLPTLPDFQTRYENTGLADQLFSTYGQQRTPYFLALAALYDGHRLGGDRSRFGTAVSMAQRFRDANPSAAPVARRNAGIVQALALIALDQPDDARALLESLLDPDFTDHARLRAQLADAALLEQQNQADNATANLAAARRARINDPSQALSVILLADAESKLRLAANPSQLDAAYAPYWDLLDRLDPSVQTAVADFLAQRWAPTVQSTRTPSNLPPRMLAVVADYAARFGNAQRQAGAADSQAWLQLAIDLSQPIAASDLSPELKAQTALRAAVARVLLDEQNPQGRIDAADQLVALANEFPMLQASEEAIALAVAWLRAMHEQQPDGPGVQDALARAYDVLFTQFPTSHIADDQRLYFGYHLLYRQQRYDEAAAAFTALPPNHTDYYQARRFALLARYESLNLDPDTASALWRRLESDAERLITEAAGADDQRTALGAALVRASIALRFSDADGTLRVLDNAEALYPDAGDDLHLQAAQNRLVALAIAGQDEPLRAQATALMQARPDDAARSIQQVIALLEQRINQTQTRLSVTQSMVDRDTLEARITATAATAGDLASLLVQWGRDQNLEPAQLLPIQLLQARALWLAGDAEQATRLLRPIHDDHPNQLDVVHHYAEAQYHTQQPDALRQAFQLYNRIARQYDRAPLPRPDLWWNARLRQLQIADQLDEGSDAIGRTIRRLRDRVSPDLGGPRYRPEFERLLQAHP